MKKKQKSLSHEFDITKLVPIISERARIYEKTNSIYKTVTTNSSKVRRDGSLKVLVRIKISEDIGKKLNYQSGDLIAIYHCPDNVKKLYFMKAENGHKLSWSEGFYQFSFNWKPNLVPLEICPSQKLDYEIIKAKPENLITVLI